MTTAAHKIASNTLYQAVGKVLGTGLGVLSFAFMSRYLGPADFGVYATALTHVALFATFADLGLPVMHLRMRALRGGDKGIQDSSELRNLHGLRILSTLLLLLVGVLAGFILPYGPKVVQGIMILSVGFIAVSFSQYIAAVFQEKLITIRLAASEVLGRAVMFGIVFFAVQFDAGLVAIYGAVVAGSFAALLLAYILIKNTWRIIPEWIFSSWPGLLKKASALILLTTFSLIYFKIDTLLLAWIRSDHEVGIYTAAYKYLDVFITFPALFSTLALPFMARAMAANNKPLLSRRFERAFRAVMIVGIPLALGTFFFGGDFVQLLSGSSFAESADVLTVLSLAVLPLFIGNLTTTTLIGIGRAKIVAWIFGVAAVIGVLAYIVAINYAGYWGAAWVTIAVESVIALAGFAAMTRFVDVRSIGSRLLGLVAAGAIAGAALYATSGQHIAIRIGLMGLLYAAALLITRAVSRDELQALISFTRHKTKTQSATR